MKRRDLLKFALFSALAAAAGTGFLKIYKHHTGVKNIFKFPAPILRKIYSPVDTIDDKIISLSQQMIATLRYYSLIGFFSRAFLSRGLSATNQYAALLTHEIDHLNGILFIDYEHAGLNDT